MKEQINYILYKKIYLIIEMEATLSIFSYN